ncbi:hypothetical protein SEA_EMMA1919_239 [Streptomyces phage Emma1919]|nr:hypothetical protein SEA_EMMA1919_239 [Streptomyces phage Emma1919]
MNVWVVTEGNCTCCNWYVGGVFSTEEKANAYISKSEYKYSEIDEAIIDEED